MRRKSIKNGIQFEQSFGMGSNITRLFAYSVIMVIGDCVGLGDNLSTDAN